MWGQRMQQTAQADHRSIFSFVLRAFGWNCSVRWRGRRRRVRPCCVTPYGKARVRQDTNTYLAYNSSGQTTDRVLFRAGATAESTSNGGEGEAIRSEAPSRSAS